jgi:hypothetical protein
MKSSLTNLLKSFLPLICVGLFLASVGAAKAQILLTVDITNNSAITITATGANASTNVNAYLSDGIDLLNFFGSSTGAVNFNSNITSSTLTASGTGTDTFTQGNSDVYSGSNVDLNLYNLSSSATETFTTSSPAFNGTMILDLSSYAANLRNVGTGTFTGTIITGFYNDAEEGSGSPNTPIGTYQIITMTAPEPSTWALLIAAAVLLAIFRARTKARQLKAVATTK